MQLYSCTLTPRKAYTSLDTIKEMMHSALSLVPQRGYGRFIRRHEELEEEAYPLEIA